jgi:UDP-GlcNAc:undecaprenyl-phosphate GlcNAc-1-phosphate transferase
VAQATRHPRSLDGQMPESLNFIAFAVATGVTAIATPAAIAVARRTSFFDHPGGYKEHGAPTPYLGGVAVVLGLVAGAVALAWRLGHLEVILVAAAALLVVGTLDDRFGLGIVTRLLAEVAAAAFLFFSGLGWSAFGSGPLDFILTVAFVLAVVNAYNLMDNLDGAAASVAAVAAASISLYATFAGDGATAVFAAALAGACAGFLPFNLARPRARIFLGDGGSMAIGVTLAALLMSMPSSGFGWELLPVMVVMVGLPAFDTALVIVSRRRRGVNVLSGGRDHLTHRLSAQLGSPWRVAVAMAAGQAACAALAIGLLQLNPAVGFVAACTLLVCGAGLIAAIEAPLWGSRAISSAAVVRDEA